MTAVPVWQTPAIRRILCRAASLYTQCGLSFLICIRYRKTYRPSMQFSKINPLCTLRFPEINKIAYLRRIHKKVIHIIHRKVFTFLVFSQHIPTLYTFYPHVVFFVLPLYLAIFSRFFPELPPKCRSRPNLSTKLSTLSTFSYHFTYTQDIPRLSTILSTR